MRKLSAAGRLKKKAAPKGPTDVAPRVIVPASPFQMVLRAASFAARKHHGQTRADNQTPYFSHVARVTLILTHVFGVHDEEVLTAALLHDTLEDTATDYDELAALFGERVAAAVVLLTKNVMLPKKQREEDYVQRLRKAPERLLYEFGRKLKTALGRSAHAKLSTLLNEVKTLQLAEAAPGMPTAATD